MKVNVKVFGDVQEKLAGAKKTPVWEQQMEIIGTETTPGCPFTMGHFEKSQVLQAGMYTADFVAVPGAFGRLSCALRNYVSIVAARKVA